jgi:hypothetical protein
LRTVFRDRHVTKGLCLLWRARAGSKSAVLAAFSPLRSRKLTAAGVKRHRDAEIFIETLR